MFTYLFFSLFSSLEAASHVACMGHAGRACNGRKWGFPQCSYSWHTSNHNATCLPVHATSKHPTRGWSPFAGLQEGGEQQPLVHLPLRTHPHHPHPSPPPQHQLLIPTELKVTIPIAWAGPERAKSLLKRGVCNLRTQEHEVAAKPPAPNPPAQPWRSSFLPAEAPAEVSSVNSDVNGDPIKAPTTRAHPWEGAPMQGAILHPAAPGTFGLGGAGVTGDAVLVTVAGFRARAEEVLPQHRFSTSSLNSEEDEKVSGDSPPLPADRTDVLWQQKSSRPWSIYNLNPRLPGHSFAPIWFLRSVARKGIELCDSWRKSGGFFSYLLIILLLPYHTLDLRFCVFSGDTFAARTTRPTVDFLSFLRLMESPGISYATRCDTPACCLTLSPTPHYRSACFRIAKVKQVYHHKKLQSSATSGRGGGHLRRGAQHRGISTRPELSLSAEGQLLSYKLSSFCFGVNSSLK